MQIIDLPNKCFNPKVIPRNCSSRFVPCYNYDSKLIAYLLRKEYGDMNCHKEPYKVKGV